MKSRSTVQPEKISVIKIGEQAKVRLTANSQLKTIENEQGQPEIYEYDEVVFEMPYKENLNRDIEDNFELYFAHGIRYMEQQEVLKNKKHEVQRLVTNSELPSELQILMMAIAEAYEEMISATLDNSLAIVEIFERLESGQ